MMNDVCAAKGLHAGCGCGRRWQGRDIRLPTRNIHGQSADDVSGSLGRERKPTIFFDGGEIAVGSQSAACEYSGDPPWS